MVKSVPETVCRNAFFGDFFKGA